LLAGCGSGNQTGPQQPTASEAGVINFADARYGLRLVYPIDWSESDVVAEHAVLVLHRNDESFTVLAQPVSETDLNAMERRAVEKYRGQFDRFELIESSSARLGGGPARRIVCRGSTRGGSGSGGGGQQFELMNTLAAYRGQGYAAIYAASPATFEKGRADAQRIIDSVQFTK